MKLVSRSGWGWSGNLGPGFNYPLDHLVVHHSVTSQSQTFRSAMKLINRIGHQRFGRGSYQYCIHRSGRVGVLAGDTIGAHTANFNSKAIGICFIGNYQNDRLTSAQVQAFHDLREWLIRTGRTTNSPLIRPHQSFKSTACPGNDVVRKWSDLVGARQEHTKAPRPPRISPVITRTKQLQRHLGVSDDGIIGPITREAMHRNYVGWRHYIARRRPVPALRGNDNHGLVRWLQRQGVRKGAYPSHMIDGVVGPRTNHVIVVALRQRDGICGPRGYTNAVK